MRQTANNKKCNRFQQIEESQSDIDCNLICNFGSFESKENYQFSLLFRAISKKIQYEEKYDEQNVGESTSEKTFGHIFKNSDKNFWIFENALYIKKNLCNTLHQSLIRLNRLGWNNSLYQNGPLVQVVFFYIYGLAYFRI